MKTRKLIASTVLMTIAFEATTLSQWQSTLKALPKVSDAELEKAEFLH